MYCREEGLWLLLGKFPDLINLEKLLSHEELNDIEKVDSEKQHKIFVTTDEKFMRGLDFRARKVGMALLVNAPFSCPREMSQGMNRVGRFSD